MNMAFDFKKEYRDLYLPKQNPCIVDVPEMKFIGVQGSGDPNEEGGAYKTAIGQLYGIAYTLKMSRRSGYEMKGFFDYTVPPLEGFWHQEGRETLDPKDKDSFEWLSVTRVPDFVTEADVRWAIQQATVKKKQDFQAVQFFTLREGLCVQCLHVGAYDAEEDTLARMGEYAEAQGYRPDFSAERRHHEIYLGDPRRTVPEKLKTVLRIPIRKLEPIC